MMYELKSTYDLSAFSDAQILAAVENAKGNYDDVFLHLFA